VNRINIHVLDHVRHVHIHILSDTLMYDKVHVAAADAVRDPGSTAMISRMVYRRGLPAFEAAHHWRLGTDPSLMIYPVLLPRGASEETASLISGSIENLVQRAPTTRKPKLLLVSGNSDSSLTKRWNERHRPDLQAIASVIPIQ
jgi:hypothetical protein